MAFLKRGIVFTIIFFVLPAFSQNENKADSLTVKTVPFVDLNKYAGKWYEIARIPNNYQNNCVSNATATYILREDGDIDVIKR